MKKLCATLALLLLCAFICPFFCSAAVSPPPLSAKSAVLINAADGSVLFEKNAYERMGMASTTKIMTALIIAEDLPLSRIVSVPREAVNTEGSSVYLCEGERLSVEELLYALLLASANDAAAALAVIHSGSIAAFANKMNERAETLGLGNTHFVNPHGLYDEQHYTTAYDLARLSAAALSNKDILRIASTQKTSIPQGVTPDCPEGISRRYLQNHNKLLRSYDGAIGLKTGFTKKTGRCLVGAAERDGLRLISVTLSAPDDWNDHRAMLDYGFAKYEHVTLLGVGEYRFDYPICGGENDHITLTNKEEISLDLPRDHTDKVEYTVTSPQRFEFAPVFRGARIAELTVYINGRSITVPLYAAQTVEKNIKNKK